MRIVAVACLALIGLMGCAQDNREYAMTDGEGADLQLASFSRPDDIAARGAASPRTLGAAAQVNVTMDRTITSGDDRAGETVTTTVAVDVKDSGGLVVIPAGSRVELLITQLESVRKSGQADGKLAFRVTTATVRGERYPIAAKVTSVTHVLRVREAAAGEPASTGMADRDVVVNAGAPVQITLSGPLTVASELGVRSVE
ncbi:MAG: hypothetical protein ABI742_09925 [Gemmatimonadota bacterium]